MTRLALVSSSILSPRRILRGWRRIVSGVPAYDNENPIQQSPDDMPKCNGLTETHASGPLATKMPQYTGRRAVPGEYGRIAFTHVRHFQQLQDQARVSEQAFSGCHVISALYRKRFTNCREAQGKHGAYCTPDSVLRRPRRVLRKYKMPMHTRASLVIQHRLLLQS